MNAQPLFLKPNQVPFGMLAYLCASGTSTPETDDNGVLLPPFRLLLGGVPMRAKWYVFDPAKNGMPSGGFEYDAVREGCQFKPVDIFSADDAPVRKKYAVFVGNDRLKYDDYPREFVDVAKATDGRIVSFNGRAYDHWLGEFKLAEGAMLVPIGDFAAQWDFAVLGCIGIPKPSPEQRTILEKLGVVFFDHAPYAKLSGRNGLLSVSFTFHDYAAVRLPTGWRMIESEGWYFKYPFKIEIRDTKGRPIARIRQEPHEYTQDATWAGTLTLD
jgi:hypothetical protein